MAVGAGRVVGAGLAVVAAVATLVGIMMAASAVAAFQQQAAELDPSEARIQTTARTAAIAVGAAIAGALVLLFSWLVYGVSSLRARRRKLERAPGPRIVTLVATALVVGSLAFAGLSPDGAFYQAAAFAAQEGDAGTVTVETFQGNITGASFAGQATAEAVHAYAPTAARGEIRLRMGSDSGPVAGFRAYAILEERLAGGDWQEVARTEPVADSTVDIPARDYAGELRFRVRMQEGATGQVGYLLAVSFRPV